MTPGEHPSDTTGSTFAPMTSPAPRGLASLADKRALLFDLDGVLTPTAEVHMRAWKRLFTGYLEGKDVEQYTDDDYFRYVDGKPRYDGVRSLLASRGITLPDGQPDDAPGTETVCGLGNLKNDAFTAELAGGMSAYPGSLDFLEKAQAAGYAVAVVSSSRNAVPVLEASGLRRRFEVIVDGLVAAERKLPGKPAPDTFLAAADALGVDRADCVVLEDAHSGVEAGHAGRFGLVIGVNRGVGAQTLLDSGADVVVDDLADAVDSLRS